MRKLITIIWIIVVLLWTTQALSIKFSDINQTMKTKYSDIHFWAWWNNFIWWIFWMDPIILDEAEEIIVWYETIRCKKQLNWLYFNANRWNRIWPMDQVMLMNLKKKSSNYRWLSMKWWLYTNCDKDTYGVYGMLKYTINWDDSYVIAWLKFDQIKNKIASSEFDASFQYKDWFSPVWYIFDSYWWIWLVGWQMGWTILSNKTLTDISQTDNIDNSQAETDNIDNSSSLLSIIRSKFEQKSEEAPIPFQVKKVTNDTETESVDKNLQSKILLSKNLVVWWNSFVPNSVLITEIDELVPNLCKWSWQSFEIDFSKDIICIDWARLNSVDIDMSYIIGKTLIVKSTDLILQGKSMESDQSLDIFIQGWNLILWDIKPSSWFNWNWDVVTLDSPVTVTSWVNINWTLIIDWLLLGSQANSFLHKLYIHGFVVSNNSYWIAVQKKFFVEWWVMKAYKYNDFIDLNNVFTRRCWENKKSTDGVNCSNKTDKYWENPLIVIDRKWSSRIRK